MNSKDLRNIASVYEAVYGGGKKEEKKDTRLVVTAADKKANTKAYQNYKAGNKAYKAADHLGEGKKADKDYDGDGKIESGTDEYMGSKDKAIKKALGKEVKDLQKAAETGKGKYVAKADKVKGVGESRRWWDVDVIEEAKAESPEEEEEKDKEDDDLAGSPNKKKKKGHDCASKVKHEEYGMGECIKEMHTLDEDGNVSHYDVLFGHGLEKNVDASTLEILEGMYHEHVINDEKNKQLQEKQKDTPDQVAAVIDMYRSKKGTGEAVKDTEKGDKKAAKKERDYAAFEREKMKKDDPNWKHKKGSTTESVDAEYIETVQKVKAAELEADIKRWGALKESGKFTVEELETMAWDIYEADTYAAQLARFEAGRQKRMKASGTYERPKWIPKDQDHSDDYGSSKGKKTTKENYQAMRNPEKEEKKDKRSAREKRMADPKKGINSPAFKEFMRQQGM